jgi:hypothetical protein
MNPSTPDIARNFLAEIFEPEGELLSVGSIAVWNKATTHTRLVSTPDDAAAVTLRPEGRNVSYFGVCTRDRNAMRKRSAETGKPLTMLAGERPELAGMPGLWVDVDVRASGHAKASLAPDVESAIAACERAIPLTPTIIVRTGGGIHAYWLFSEGVIPFAKPGNSNSREDLEMLCRSFQAMVRDELQKSGWSDDQTWALPRVMRIPGGMNVSHGDPRPVTWEKTGPRYSVADLQIVVPKGLKIVPAKEVEVHDDRIQFTIRDLDAASAVELDEFISEVCELDEEFAAVWHRKRRSLPSQSEMDMSISTRLACGDTPSQRIVDALRLHRLIGDPKDAKANRADYYLATLQRAFGACDQDRRRKDTLLAGERARSAMDRGRRLAQSDDKEEQQIAAVLIDTATKDMAKLRETALGVINEAFGLKDGYRIERIVRDRLTAGDREAWRLIFMDEQIRLVYGGQLMNCFKMRTEIFLATGEDVEPFTTKAGKPRQWAPIKKALTIAAEDIGSGDEPTQVIHAMIRYVERALLETEKHDEPFSEPWNLVVEKGHAPVVLWKSKSGESGLLIQTARWVEALSFDPLAPTGPAGSVKGWVAYLSECVDDVERPQKVSFTRPDGSRGTRRGYLRIRRAFILKHGGVDVADTLDRAMAQAEGCA